MGYYAAVIWSTVNASLRRVLRQAAAGVPVQLGIEPDHPADPHAVLILFSSRTVQRLLDIAPVTIGDPACLPEPTDWRLGYLQPDDPNRAALRQRLATRAVPLDALLRVEGRAWTVRVTDDPDPDSIP